MTEHSAMEDSVRWNSSMQRRGVMRVMLKCWLQWRWSAESSCQIRRSKSPSKQIHASWHISSNNTHKTLAIATAR